LKKAYDSLDQDRVLELLAKYGVGPKMLAFIKTFWDEIMLVPKSGRFYGTPFHPERGILTGNILGPIILNIVMDCVIREWERLMNSIPTEKAHFIMDELVQVLLFYADDGNLSGCSQQAIQQSLDLLSDLFARVGLQFNTKKTKAMVMLGSKPYGQQSIAAYKRRFDHTLPDYRARKLSKVTCPHCDRSMNDQYLPTHIREIHRDKMNKSPSTATGLGKHSSDRDNPSDTRKEARTACPACPGSSERRDHPDEHVHDVHGATAAQHSLPHPDTETTHRYGMSLPLGVRAKCPVPGCPYTATTRPMTYRHFAWCHPNDSILIIEDGTLPRCPNCGKFMHSISTKHFDTRECRRLTARRRQHRQFAEAQAAARNVQFYVDGAPIEIVALFCYLGRYVQEEDQDDTAVTENLKKARTKWGHICRILSRDGRNPRVMARLYLAVVQQVLLYGSETWVLTKHLLGRLEAFHNRCAHHMAHRHIQRRSDGTWVTPSTVDVLRRCNLSPISTYIAKRKTTLLTHYAYEHSRLYRQCLESVPTAGQRRLMWWDDDICRSIGAKDFSPREEHHSTNGGDLGHH
jgi:hypothetical protein